MCGGTTKQSIKPSRPLFLQPVCLKSLEFWCIFFLFFFEKVQIIYVHKRLTLNTKTGYHETDYMVVVHDSPVVALWDHSGPWRGHWTGWNGGKAAKVTSLGMDLTVRMGL